MDQISLLYSNVFFIEWKFWGLSGVVLDESRSIIYNLKTDLFNVDLFDNQTKEIVLKIQSKIFSRTQFIKDPYGKQIAEVSHSWDGRRYDVFDSRGNKIVTSHSEFTWKALSIRLNDDQENLIGYLEKKKIFSLKYILNVANDKERKLDKRIALALGIILSKQNFSGGGLG
jgi:hypothetical protein